MSVGARVGVVFARSPKRRRAWARHVLPRLGMSLCRPNRDQGFAVSVFSHFHCLPLVSLFLRHAALFLFDAFGAALAF